MKKILTILGSIAFLSTATIGVISCATPTNFSKEEQAFLEVIDQTSQKDFHNVDELITTFTTDLKKWTTDLNDEKIQFIDNVTIDQLGEPQLGALIISQVNTKQITDDAGTVLTDQVKVIITYYYVIKNRNTGALSWEQANPELKITFVKQAAQPTFIFKGIDQ